MIKYTLAGGVATIANLISLYIFHDLFEIKIVIATSLSFMVAFIVSFFLQKFWTFKNKQRSYIKQISYYLIINLVNFFANASLMVWLVNHLRVNYIISQILVSGGLGITSYLLYKYLVFKK